jgi:cell division protein FtsA
MSAELISILDIGTTAVRTLVGELREDGCVSIVGMGEAASSGIRKGEIVDRDEAIAAVRASLKKAEESCRKDIHSVYLTTSGGQSECKTNTGVLRLVDPDDNSLGEISNEDVRDIIEVARKVSLPENRIRLHTLQHYFQIDDMTNVVNPVGMTGEELRLDMLTIHGKRSSVDNFKKIVDDVPIKCNDAVFSGLCAALAVVTGEQKKAGALVIDIGGGTTTYLLYHDGLVQAAGSIAVGGDHVTNDISMGLRIPFQQAEKLKLQHGNALTNLMERDHNISIPAQQGFAGKIIRAVTLNIIVNARMDEIFSLVKKGVEHYCPNVPLGAGVLLTGGGSFLTGTRDLGQKVFNAPCALGKPFDVTGLPSTKDGPLYASHIGCIRYVDSLREKVELPSVPRRLLNWFLGGQHG